MIYEIYIDGSKCKDLKCCWIKK